MTTGVVVMAYGTPRHPDEIEAYYTDIRRGRPPTADQLADLVARYRAIGGISPLAERTEEQRVAIAAALDKRRPGEFVVELGQKHAAPSIEDAVAKLHLAGVDRVVGIVLAPHYSSFSIAQYLDRARSAAKALHLPFAGVESWHLEPAYIEFLVSAVREAVAGSFAGMKVIFTAHSLPQRIIDAGDPYPSQLRETASAVAQRVGLAEWSQWAIAWQSAGRTPEPWLGPDILTVLRDLGASEGASRVVVCACGFVADHLEVLYDLDIEAARVAFEAGLTFARTRCVNDDPAVMGALADLVIDRAR